MADTHHIQCPHQDLPDPQQCPRMILTMRPHIRPEPVRWWSTIWIVLWIHSFKIQWEAKNLNILSLLQYEANNRPLPCYQPFLPPTQATLHPTPQTQCLIDQWTSKIYSMERGVCTRSQLYVLSSLITSELKIVRPDQIIRPSLNKIVWRWTDQSIKSEDQTHTNTHTYKKYVSYAPSNRSWIKTSFSREHMILFLLWYTVRLLLQYTTDTVWNGYVLIFYLFNKYSNLPNYGFHSDFSEFSHSAVISKYWMLTISLWYSGDVMVLYSIHLLLNDSMRGQTIFEFQSSSRILWDVAS